MKRFYLAIVALGLLMWNGCAHSPSDSPTASSELLSESLTLAPDLTDNLISSIDW